MRVLRAADHRRMPWKNGGGETAEILVHPAGASVDEFGWRISMATVATDGPFSLFPGVDRTLTLLEGPGIDLDVDCGPTYRLRRRLECVRFPADRATFGRLAGATALDLNVMTRRGRFDHSVARAPLTRSFPLAIETELIILFCAEGRFAVSAQGRSETLDRYDAVLATGSDVALDVAVAEPAELLLIEIVTL